MIVVRMGIPKETAEDWYFIALVCDVGISRAFLNDSAEHVYAGICSLFGSITILYSSVIARNA